MNNHEETKKIKEVLKDYTEGTFEADGKKIKKTFHEKAVMNGYLDENLILATPQTFIDDMESAPSMKSQGYLYNSELENIRIEGNIASAIISETGFKGKGVLVNYFHLIKINERWQIISKIFTTIQEEG